MKKHHFSPLATLLTLLCLILSGCGSEDPPLAAGVTPAETSPSTGNTVDAAAMLAIINQERADQGLGALAWDADLEVAALRHTQECMTTITFPTPAPTAPV